MFWKTAWSGRPAARPIVQWLGKNAIRDRKHTIGGDQCAVQIVITRSSSLGSSPAINVT